VRDLWYGLPALARGVVAGIAGVLVLLLLGAGVWSLLERREAAATRALGSATGLYREALAGRQESQLAGAAAALNQFLKDWPRSRHVAEAGLLLGNVEYERRDYDAALQAFERAAAGRDSIATLGRLGVGYAAEAKGDLARALAAYTDLLKGRGPQDFLYGDLLLAKGRVEEGLAKRADAIATYQLLLKEVPASPAAETIRTRLAMLGAQA
jgi:TolA-binding protein